MARGAFDNLPGAGKPIKNLGTQPDFVYVASWNPGGATPGRS